MVVFGEHHQCHPVLMSTLSLRGWHNVVGWVRYSYPSAVGNSAPTPIPHLRLYGHELVCVRNRNPSGGRFCAWAPGREKVNPEGGAARSLLKISAEEPQEPEGKAVSRMQRSCFCEGLYTGQGWASSQLSHWRSRGSKIWKEGAVSSCTSPLASYKGDCRSCGAGGYLYNI